MKIFVIKSEKKIWDGLSIFLEGSKKLNSKMDIKGEVGIIAQKVEMGPDPTRAYFWPTVNKRPTRLWPRYFPTRSNFFWSEGKKIEKFDIFRGNFLNSNPNHKWLTPPDPRHKKLTRPDLGQKFLTRTHHYQKAIWLKINSNERLEASWFLEDC